MDQIYQVLCSLPTATGTGDSASFGGKLYVPVCESLNVVEFGTINTGTVDPSGMVVALESVSAADTPIITAIKSLTVPAGATAGDLVSQRCDIEINKAAGSYQVAIEGVPGTPVVVVGGIAYLRMSVTTGVDSTVTAFYVKFAACGTPKDATTGQIVVIT